MSRWAPVAAFLASAVLALVFATAHLADAYDWVAHTSDVRVAIARAELATSPLGPEAPDACARVENRLEDFNRLTRRPVTISPSSSRQPTPTRSTCSTRGARA